jgi:hypothetical protein
MINKREAGKRDWLKNAGGFGRQNTEFPVKWWEFGVME